MTAAGPDLIPVYAVVPPRVLLLDVAGPVEVLRKANLEQNRVRFVIHPVAPIPRIRSSVGLELAGLEPLPDHVPGGALVVIAGSTAEPLGPPLTTAQEEAAAEQAVVSWLKAVVRPGVTLVSICSGALLAAQAGLLSGYGCTTHHACTDALARLAPGARVLENRLYVEDGERLSSAGITAGIDLMLHLVAQRAGHACAAAVARYLVVYSRRAGGDPQLSPWLEGRNHLHPAVHRAQDAVSADPARDWPLSTLAREAGASPRHLSRLFNEHAGMSVTEYVNRLRLALAQDLLTGTRLDMETVAERAGFGSARQFRRAWGRLHTLPPSRVR